MAVNSDIHQLTFTLMQYPFTTTYTGTEEENARIRELPNRVQLSPPAKAMLQRLVDSVGTGANTDNEYHLNIDHMLYELSHVLDRVDGGISRVVNQRDLQDYLSTKHSLVEEYMMEMYTGDCPAGRSVRLFELLFALPK